MKPLKLEALVARCRKPIFVAAEDVAQTATALLDLVPYLNPRETRECTLPLKRFARRDPSFLQSALSSTGINAASEADGKRMAAVSRVVPADRNERTAALWALVASSTSRALDAGVWAPSDLKVIMYHIHHFGTYETTLVETASRYIHAALPSATAGNIPALASMATSLPELITHPSAPLDAVALRSAILAESLTPGAIGHVCGQLNRTNTVNMNAAVAFQEEAGRCAEKGDTFTAAQLFCFVARHKAEHISSDAMVWLMERITGEDLDIRTLENLLAALQRLPFAARAALRQEVMDFGAFLSLQAQELLQKVSVAQGGLCGSDDAVAIQHFVSHVLELSEVLRGYADPQWPPEFLAAADACAASVEPVQEALLSAESSPLGLIIRLLETPTVRCKEVGLGLLREAASQCVALPTLQTFQFLLLMGDHQLHDLTVTRYLRDQFAKTATDVPPVQLCVAMRCLGVAAAQGNAGATEIDAEQEKEKVDAFLEFCVEVARKHLSQGAPLRCILATTENLYRMGCRDAAFFADVAAYISTKKAVTSAEKESADSAAMVCAAFGEDLLDQYPSAHELLLDVVQQGVKGETAMLPTQWMNLHDPSNALTPLTPPQQESWDIIEEMVRTRTDDTAKLTQLAEKYLTLLPFARPDDHKYFFGVFEEKVLKEDKLLKTCLEAIIDSGTLGRLSSQTIASILNSLAAIRFKYFASIKRFTSGITEEQWASMEAAPLVQILAGMEKLSLRTPVVLRRIGVRLGELCRFLTPYDTAQAIHALQALGHNDAALLSRLAAHAAASARRFDEMSMALLFSTPSIHRLVNTADVARPLLLQASAKIRSPQQREKIATWVRRSSLPRELVDESTTRLQVTSKSVKEIPAPLRLA